MIVYADMLLLLNGLINFLLLDGTARLAGRDRAFPRLLLGAGVGAVYALLCVFPPLHFLGSLPGKGAAALLMLLCSFGGKGLLRLALWFLLLSAAFAGVVLLLTALFGSEVYLLGGTAVYPVSFGAMVLTAGCTYGLMGLALQRFGTRSGLRDLLPATVCLNGRKLRLTALMDSGNSLRDPISGKGVLVLDPGCVEALCPGMGEAVRHPTASFSEAAELLPGARLVPYSAVGAQGLLLAARCDWVLLGTKKIPGATLAFSPTPISDGAYQLIAGGDSI